MRSSHREDVDLITTEEAFQALRVDDLKGLARLLGKDVPNRKAELVRLLAKTMQNPDSVRMLYEQLDETGKAMVREATHDAEGRWHPEQFHAKYGRSYSFHDPQTYYYDPAPPTILWLFFPNFVSLPVDLRQLLLTFVPEPQLLGITATDEQPTTVRLTRYILTTG